MAKIGQTYFAKRHYEAIARAMQDTKPTSNVFSEPEKHAQWNAVVDELADTFARDNGLFKRDRFIRACEPGANVRARS